jgi:hypothetical protein
MVFKKCQVRDSFDVAVDLQLLKAIALHTDH